MSEKRLSRRELTRRNKKRNKTRKSFRTLMIIAVTALFLYITGLYGASLAYFGDFISGGMMLLEIGGGYPVEGDYSRLIQAQPMGTGLRVLDADNLTVYSPTGKRVFTYSHSMTNPVITSSGTRVLLYDLNDTSLKVANGHNVLFQQDMSGNIIHACISGSNRVAVTTRSSGYNGEVTVYNYNMNPRFVWYCAEAFPIYSSFSDNGKTLAVTAVQTDGGLLYSYIYIIDVAGGEEKYSIDSSDYPLTTKFLDNNRLLIAYTGKLVIWDIKNNRQKREYSYPTGSMWSLEVKSPYIAVAYGGYELSGNGGLSLLADDLTEKFAVSLTDGIKDISISQSRVFALGNENLYEYDYSANLVNTTPTGSLTKALVDYSGTMMISSTHIKKVESTRSR